MLVSYVAGSFVILLRLGADVNIDLEELLQHDCTLDVINDVNGGGV